MAQQIKKKYLKDGSVDGSKIKILSGQSIVAENASSQLVELLKINASNKVEAVGQEISYKSELDQEVSDRQSGDSQNAAGLAEEILDRQAGDDDLRSDLDQEVLDRQSAVSAEQSRAENEENLLKGRVTTAEGDIDSLESRMMSAEGAIINEVSRAEGEENLLKNRVTTAEGDIDSLESRMMSAEGAISTEQSRAEGEENLLKNRMTTAEGDIDSLESRMMSAESSIINEVSRAESEENLLKGRMTTAEGDIDSLESRMMSAESGLSTETSARISGDQLLQSQVDVEKGRIDAILSASTADKDSFAEIVQLINSVDTENDSAFASYVLSNNAALAQEILDRQSDVDSEETRAIGVEASLQSQITQEVSDRQSAVSAEQSRAEGVEADLQSAIDAEVLARQTAVSAEQSRAEGVEAGLQSAIDSEAATRQEATDILSSMIGEIEPAYFKHDGSRKMTGDIVMADSISDYSNSIKWEFSEGSEGFSVKVGIPMIQTGFSGGNGSSGESSTLTSGSGLQTAKFQFEVTDPETGDVITPGYSKSVHYNADGITSQSNFVVDIMGNLTQTSFGKATYISGDETRFVAPPSLPTDANGEPIEGSEPYFPRQFVIKTDGTVEMFMQAWNQETQSLESYGNTIFYPGEMGLQSLNENGGFHFASLSGERLAIKNVNLVDLDNNSEVILPTEPGHATPKQYVDDQVANALSVGSSNLVEAKAYTDQKVADLVNSAPAVLDTLKELSDALGNDANFATSVASSIGDVSDRVSVVESITNGKHKVVLSSSDITNGYIDLPHVARVESMMGFVDRLAIHSGEDYTAEVVSLYDADVTRITFIGDLVGSSEQALVAGDTIFFRYEFYSA